jgi:hypothetical protein
MTYDLGLIKKYLMFLLTLIYTNTGKAQFMDSLLAAMHGHGSVSFSFNSRNSTISGQSANIFGFMIGDCFGKKFTVGGGFNTLSSNIYRKEITGDDTINQQLNFFFFSYYVEYILNFSKHWRMEIPVALGIGNSFYSYNQSGKSMDIDQHFIALIEPQAELDYNFNRYVGLYAQFGYRLMVINNPFINKNFNSVTESAGILIYPLEIYAGIFPKTKLAHWIEQN